MKRWLLVITVLTVAGLLTACGPGDQGVAPQAETSPDAAEPAQAESAPVPASTPAFATQSNGERAVEVDITPLNLTSGRATLDFEVVFNTHSVDLSFDPAAISVLRDDRGGEYPAIAWEGSGPGGHHRSGILRFSVPDPTSEFVEVAIHDVAGVPERVFRWDLAR
jgi:hypothetical protein